MGLKTKPRGPEGRLAGAWRARSSPTDTPRGASAPGAGANLRPGGGLGRRTAWPGCACGPQGLGFGVYPKSAAGDGTSVCWECGDGACADRRRMPLWQTDMRYQMKTQATMT